MAQKCRFSQTGEEDFALTVAKVVFNISGTQEAPVRCVRCVSH